MLHGKEERTKQQSMENPAIIILLFALLLTPSHGEFDYFQLVQQWPRSYCDLKTHLPCERSPDNFTVHGLWPTNFSTTTICPEFPGYIKFGYPSKFTLDLDNRWPDLRKTSKDTQQYQVFWDHEWTSHGTCSSNLYSKSKYFTLGMQLKDKYYLLKILQESTPPITPGMNVKVDDVHAAIKANTGVEPMIKCSTRPRPRPPRRPEIISLQLLEIVICLKRDGNSVIDCPKAKSGSCYTSGSGLTVYFPPP